MLLFIISFIGGVLTVLAPCILPLLPIIIGGSISGGSNRKKALTIILSLGVSVILFTFILKVSTIFISIPQSVWMWISGGIIIVFGIITLVPGLWENQFLARVSAESNVLLGKGNQKNSFWGDVLVGASLGLVFSSCSPAYIVVLATVLPANLFLGSVYLLSYTLGLCLSLGVISIVGQKIVDKLGIAADPNGWFKKILGIIFILVGIAILTGFATTSQLFVANSGFFDVTQIEQKLLEARGGSGVPTQTNTTSQATTTALAPKELTLQEKAKLYQKAPELQSPDAYINTPRLASGQAGPITLAEFKGKKVVLLDVWTYSCINCLRTLPYVKAWYAKYKDMGLEVIGLHTPEFAFEHVLSNVQTAVNSLGITYPVVLDNEYATWNAYGNQYWPREYLIDKDGFVVYDHIGEGGDTDTEAAIQKALSELNGTSVSGAATVPKDMISISANKVQSPETYFGSARNEYLANGNQGASGMQTLTLPTSFDTNALYLDGMWNFSGEYATSEGPSKIVFKYNAKNVYIVGSSDVGVTVTILKDGVKQGTLLIKANQLYPLIQGSDYGEHTLEVDVPAAGLNAFTLTFG